MATSRTYGDGCAIAQALDLVGERWALLVVRELLLGPKRYTDLRRGLARAGPTVVSQRLSELESAGVIRRRRLAPPSSARVYELTDWGRELEGVVVSLGRWAAAAPTPPRAESIASPDSVVLAMRDRFDPGDRRGLSGTFALQFGEDRFQLRITRAEIEVTRAEAIDPDATIATDPDTLSAVLWSGQTLGDAEREQKLTIAGDHAAAARLLDLFPLPEPIDVDSLP
jgi:DNA-binding HxlR family transcriptional regulator